MRVSPTLGLIILFLLCGTLTLAQQPVPSPATVSAHKHLIEITFATDDKAPTKMFHTVVTYWISDTSLGWRRDVYDWAVQGGSKPDADAVAKAEKCVKLFKTLDRSKLLSDDPNKIVTVRVLDNGKLLSNTFPIENVPVEVHQMLTIMGIGDERIERLKFSPK